MVNAMVHPENFTAPQDKQKWLLNRITDGVKKVTLDLSTFVGGANESKYFASIDDENTVAYLYSGIPLARINNTNNLGRMIRLQKMAVRIRLPVSLSLRSRSSSPARV